MGWRTLAGCNYLEPDHCCVSRCRIFSDDQKRPFVHGSVCSQCLEGLFAILAECSQFCLRSVLLIIEIQQEIHRFADWEGGG